ncbi:CNPY2 protein, partial [Glaucidium brasilianum]|nr:CNPY2 protein [Glaucidium brasilianum]
ACKKKKKKLEWEIAQVDPKKKKKKGSFRINPDGSQSVVEVPKKKKKKHLTELLERVCEKKKKKGEKVDPSTHRKKKKKKISRDGTRMDLSKKKKKKDVASSLKFACESIAEEYEDKKKKKNSHEADNVKDRQKKKKKGEPWGLRPLSAATVRGAPAAVTPVLRGERVLGPPAPASGGAHSPLPSSQSLKDVLANMIPKEQAKIKSFRQQHGSTAIGQITVDM